MNSHPQLFIENLTSYTVASEIFNQVWHVFQQEESISSDKIVQLTLVDDSKMIQLNKKYRGAKQATDVLTFSLKQDFIPLVGDIIIDIEMAQRQRGKKNLNDELQELFLHGLLHLWGYDHISSSQKNTMKKKEHKLKNRIREKTSG